MSRIPKDVDDLMWSVAESGDSQAVKEFGNRFPHLRGELLKRLQMVGQLKRSGIDADRPTPAMSKKAPSGSLPPSSQIAVAYAIGGAALACLVVIGIFILIRPKIGPPTPPPAVPYLGGNTQPMPVRSDPNPGRIEPPGTTRTVPPATSPVSGQAVGTNGTALGQVPPPSDSSVPPNSSAAGGALDRRDIPISITLRQADLKLAMQMLGLQAKLKIQLAPGMMDPKVDFDYHDATPRQIIEDMGARYGFSGLYQGGDWYVLVPVREGTPTKGTTSRSGASN